MSILDFNVPDAVEKTEDFVGFDTVPTGFYELTLGSIFLDRSQGGAAFAAIQGTLVPEGSTDKGSPFSENVYFTSGDKKGRSTTYEKNGKTYLLPGLEMLNNLCEIVTGKNLKNQTTEPKLVEVWKEGNRVKESREVLVDLEGMVVNTAIEEVIENKREKNAADQYVATSETRKFNRIAKFLYPQGHTYNEKLDGTAETTWKDRWSKNVGKTKDNTQKTVDAPAPAGKPPISNGAAVKTL